MTISKVSGYSTALFSTWFYLPEPGILFDAGDGVSATLLQRSRGIKHIFISHADRDHLGGLMQLLQLNAREEYPKVYYPRDSGSFPALRDFTRRFDPHVPAVEWIPIKSGNEIFLQKDLMVRVVRNDHILTDPDVHKSFSFQVFGVRRKLRPEWQGRPGTELANIRKQRGEAALTYRVLDHQLSYSGDTPPVNDQRWAGARILIHEATFLNAENVILDDPRYHRHSLLPDVLHSLREQQPEHLILSHFSTRYDEHEIREALREQLNRHRISSTIHLVLPGQQFELDLSNVGKIPSNSSRDAS